jgi:hypothetical protein
MDDQEAQQTEPVGDLELEAAEAEHVTAGDGTTTTDSQYRGRYQLHLGEAPPPTTG